MATPYMGLTLPTVSVTPGPTWASDLNADFELVDAHDHTTGKGVPITTPAISITADLDFNSYSAIGLTSVRVENQSSALAASYTGAYYMLSSNPMFANNSGSTTRLVNVSYPLVVGDMLYASSTTAFGRLSIGSTGQVLKVSGGLPTWASSSTTFNVVSKAFADSPYTISATDDVILCNSASGAMTLNLPVSSGGGKVYTIKKTSSDVNAVTIARAGSDTITDVSASLTSTSVNTQGEELDILDATSGVWQVIRRRIPSIWVTYTPTFTGFGTVASSSIFSRREGESLRIRGVFTPGTPTGVEARMTLGFNGSNGNVTSSGSTKIATLDFAGNGVYSAVNSGVPSMLMEQSVGYITFGIQDAAHAGLTKANGDAVTSAGVALSVDALVPITGWNG